MMTSYLLADSLPTHKYRCHQRISYLKITSEYEVRSVCGLTARVRRIIVGKSNIFCRMSKIAHTIPSWPSRVVLNTVTNTGHTESGHYISKKHRPIGPVGSRHGPIRRVRFATTDDSLPYVPCRNAYLSLPPYKTICSPTPTDTFTHSLARSLTHSPTTHSPLLPVAQTSRLHIIIYFRFLCHHRPAHTPESRASLPIGTFLPDNAQLRPSPVCVLFQRKPNEVTR